MSKKNKESKSEVKSEIKVDEEFKAKVEKEKDVPEFIEITIKVDKNTLYPLDSKCNIPLNPIIFNGILLQLIASQQGSNIMSTVMHMLEPILPKQPKQASRNIIKGAVPK